MKHIVLCTLATAVLCVGQAPVARAATASPTPTIHPVLITELQTGGGSDATQEFVELYNQSADAVDVTGWQLQYRAASGTAAQTWAASTTKATIACATGSDTSCKVTLAAGLRLVLAHNMPELTDAQPMAGGFSDKGGELRLVQPGSSLTVQDFIGYGTAADAQGSPAPAPTAGKSLKRKISQDGMFIDTSNNANDFLADCGMPTPGEDDTAALALAGGCYTTPTDTPPDQAQPTNPTDDQPGKGGVTPEPDPLPAPVVYLPLLITEVLPNPAPPQQDDTDEFIELYNPNDTTVNLNGYKLQAGSNYRYSFTLGDTPLGPHNYLAIPSADSNVNLSNNGSGVRLIDPAGTIAYEVPTYGTAKEGQAWMLDDTGWHWTLTPTPGAVNALTLPAPKAATTSAATPKKSTTSTKATPKKATNTPKIPAAKKNTAKTANNSAQTVASTPTAQPQLWLLAPIGALAASYAVYEYRQDIASGVRKTWAAITKNKKAAPAALPPGENETL